MELFTPDFDLVFTMICAYIFVALIILSALIFLIWLIKKTLFNKHKSVKS